MFKGFLKWAYYKVDEWQKKTRKGSKKWKQYQVWKNRVFPLIERDLELDYMIYCGKYR